MSDRRTPAVTTPEVVDVVDILSLDHSEHIVLIAETLADLGMRVMPVQGGGKHAIPGSKGLAGATDDRPAVRVQWEEASTSAMQPGIAVEPGSAGLAVITCDNKHAVEAWELISGSDPAETASIVSVTPSGGRHFWFELPDGANPVSTHTPGMGLKASGGYVIVASGSAKGFTPPPYTHTLNRPGEAWSQLAAPHRVVPPSDDYTDECADELVEDRIHELNSLFVSSGPPPRTDEIIASVLHGEQADAGGLRWQCLMAFELISALADDAIDCCLHLGDALEHARQQWIRHCDGFGSIEARQLMWRYIRNLVIASNSYAPAAAADVAKPTGSISDLDWTEPFNSAGQVKQIPINSIAADRVSVAAALAEVWEVGPQSIVAAIDAVANKSDEPEIITQDQVFAHLFGSPPMWMVNSRQANIAGIHVRIKQRADFRTGPDSDLWRYNHAGPNVGLWTPDGADFLRRLLLRMLASNYSRFTYDTVADVVRAHCDGLQMPDDESTWQDSRLIYCKNGVVDWAANAKPRSARPEDNLTVQHSWAWDPDAECPAFDEFVARTFQGDAVQTVYEACGAVLYPMSPWKRAILVYGPKDSGKSTFLKVLTALVGKQHVSTLSLQQIGRNDFMTSELFGKRVNICGDISADEMPDPAKFKILVGGDEPIQGDKKHLRPFSFYNRAKLVFSANELPRTTDKSSAYFERWIPLKCTRIVTGDEMDIDLPKRLTAESELAGIAVKAIRGLGRLMQNHGFTLPESSRQVLDEYRMQEDFVLAWFAERVEFTGNAEDWEEKSAILSDHEAWCQEMGVRRAASLHRIAKTAGPLEHQHPGFVWSEQKWVGQGEQRQLRVAVGMKLRRRAEKVVEDI